MGKIHGISMYYVIQITASHSAYRDDKFLRILIVPIIFSCEPRGTTPWPVKESFSLHAPST